MKKIIEILGVEAEKLSPELFAALNLPIDEALNKVGAIEKDAQKFVSTSQQFDANIEKAKEALGTGNLRGNLAILEGLDKGTDDLETLARDINEVTDVSAKLDAKYSKCQYSSFNFGYGS